MWTWYTRRTIRRRLEQECWKYIVGRASGTREFFQKGFERGKGPLPLPWYNSNTFRLRAKRPIRKILRELKRNNALSADEAIAQLNDYMTTCDWTVSFYYRFVDAWSTSPSGWAMTETYEYFEYAVPYISRN